MRILVLTPFLPDEEASHGGGSYIGAICKGLRQRAELGLIHLQHQGEQTADSNTWSWVGSAPYEGSPGNRGHRLRMLWRWRRHPLLVAKYRTAAIPSLIARAKREFQPDVALVEMAQMAQYLPSLKGLTTILTDHEAGQPANAGTGFGAAADRRDRRLWSDYVQRYYPLATGVQAVTSHDADILSAALEREVWVRPAALKAPRGACAPGSAPPVALFLGDYSHQPNHEAAQRLVEAIWPRIRSRCPEAELLLAGPHEAPIAHLDGRDGVQVLGFVEDLQALLGSARLLLAPLWSGGGFRVKNATALLHGLPVVTNSLGARGCEAPEPACLVREAPASLADAAAELLCSPDTAGEAGALARSWAADHFSADKVADLQLHHLSRLRGRSPRAGGATTG